jgi:prevent-host-death family protein
MSEGNYKTARVQEAPYNSLPTAPVGGEINLKEAKDQLSRLVREAAAGREIIITVDGRPAAKLSAVTPAKRQRFQMDWSHVKSIPWRGGPDATQLVREDRDSRGW